MVCLLSETANLTWAEGADLPPWQMGHSAVVITACLADLR
jgi:hypothetical protein